MADTKIVMQEKSSTGNGTKKVGKSSSKVAIPSNDLAHIHTLSFQSMYPYLFIYGNDKWCESIAQHTRHAYNIKRQEVKMKNNIKQWWSGETGNEKILKAKNDNNNNKNKNNSYYLLLQ